MKKIIVALLVLLSTYIYSQEFLCVNLGAKVNLGLECYYICPNTKIYVITFPWAKVCPMQLSAYCYGDTCNFK
jgi:hypothetical protein